MSNQDELKEKIAIVEERLRDWLKFSNRHWYGNFHAKSYIKLLRRLRAQL